MDLLYYGGKKEMSKENTDRNNRGPIFQLLVNLDPGKRVEDVFINGKEESVRSFASFNPATGLATFTKNNGDVLVVNYERIDALEF